MSVKSPSDLELNSGFSAACDALAKVEDVAHEQEQQDEKDKQTWKLNEHAFHVEQFMCCLVAHDHISWTLTSWVLVPDYKNVDPEHHDNDACKPK